MYEIRTKIEKTKSTEVKTHTIPHGGFSASRRNRENLPLIQRFERSA